VDIQRATEAELSEYLSRISPERLAKVKWPRQACGARSRCFQYFQQGERPADITRHMAGCSRATGYRYFWEYELLQAKERLSTLQIVRHVREQREMRERKAAAAREQRVEISIHAPAKEVEQRVTAVTHPPAEVKLRVSADTHAPAKAPKVEPEPQGATSGPYGYFIHRVG